jgi:hypothetical protein
MRRTRRKPAPADRVARSRRSALEALRSPSSRGALAGFACLVATACGSAPQARGAPAARAATTAASTASTTIPRRVVHTMRRRAVHVINDPVTAIGDSVMIDAASALRRALPGVTIDAAVNRSALPGPALLLAFAHSGRLGSSIVIDLGTNGGMSASVIDEMLQIASGRRVVMVTNHCNYCSWTSAGNVIVRSACIEQRDCFVADWDALARAHPTWFASDGVHMPIGGTGARAYADLIRTQLST